MSEPAPDARVLGVALALPEPFAGELRAARERFGDAEAVVVPTHVTLLPPTTVDAVLLPEIRAHLKAVATANASFRVRLRGTGTFRPVSPVVFATLAEGIGGCERLENAVRAGVLWRPTEFPYHPHVTIAHDLPDHILDKALDELSGYGADFVADRFVLYEHVDGRWELDTAFALASPPTEA